MPGLNRKGPSGEGPMTGKKMGLCNPENKGKTEEEIIQTKSAANTDRGMRDGRGRGCGWGHGLGKGRGLAMRFRDNY